MQLVLFVGLALTVHFLRKVSQVEAPQSGHQGRTKGTKWEEPGFPGRRDGFFVQKKNWRYTIDSRAFSLHQLLRNFSTNMISQRTLGHISCKLLFHVLAVLFKTIQDHFLLAGGKPDNTFL